MRQLVFLFLLCAAAQYVHSQSYYYYSGPGPDEIYVDNVAGDDNLGDGSSGSPYQTIQRGLIDRPLTLYVAPNNGMYTPYAGTDNTNLQYDLLNGTISIRSSVPGTKFYVDMQSVGRFLRLYNSYDSYDRATVATIVDAVIMNGDVDSDFDLSEYGGCLLAQNISLTLEHVTLYRCRATYGGGVALVADTDVITNDTFVKFRITLTNSKIQYCGADEGGGMYVAGSPDFTRNAAITSSNTLYEHNIATIGGGAVFCTDGICTKFTSDQFNDNRAPSGGGVYVTGYVHTEYHETMFSDNTASTGSGGAVMADEHGAAMFYGCSFCSNFAAINGSAVFVVIPQHTVLDKPVNKFQCNVGTYPFCVGLTCTEIIFRTPADAVTYLPDETCELCAAPPSKKKRTGPVIVKPCVLQSTGVDAPGCGVGVATPCATFKYAYTNQSCDEIRVVAGDTLTGSGNREISLTSHVHMTCNGTAANCEGLGNQVIFDAGGVGNIFTLTSATTGSEADFNWWITNTNAANANTSGVDSGGIDFEGSGVSYVMTPLFRPRRCENVTGIRGGCIHAAYVDQTQITVSRCLNCYASEEGGAGWFMGVRNTASGNGWILDFNLTVACSTGGRGAIFYVGFIDTSFGILRLTDNMHYAPRVLHTTTNSTILFNYPGFSIYMENRGTGGGTVTAVANTVTGIYGAVSGNPKEQDTWAHGVYVGGSGTNMFGNTLDSIITFVNIGIGNSIPVISVADGLCYGDNAIGCAAKQRIQHNQNMYTRLEGLIFSIGINVFAVTNNVRTPSNGNSAVLFDECSNYPTTGQGANSISCFAMDALADGEGRATQPYPIDIDSNGFHELSHYFDPPFVSDGMCATSILLLVDANAQNSSAVTAAIKYALLEQYVEQPVTIRYSTFRSDGLVDTESGYIPFDFVYDFDNDPVQRDFTRKAHYRLADWLDYQGLNTTSPWATVITNAYNQHEQWHAVPTFVFMIVATGDSSSAAATAAAANTWKANNVTQFIGLLINTTITSANATTDMNNLFGSTWTTTVNSTQEGIMAGITTMMGSKYCNTSDATLGCGTTPVNEGQYRNGTNCISGKSICGKMRYNCTSSQCITHNYVDQAFNNFTGSPWWGTYDDRCVPWVISTEAWYDASGGPSLSGIFFGALRPIGAGLSVSANTGVAAQAICKTTSASQAPVCGFPSRQTILVDWKPHPDAVDEALAGLYPFVTGTSRDQAAINCPRVVGIHRPRNSTAQKYTFHGFWDINNVLQVECAPMISCYNAEQQHRDCRNSFPASSPGSYVWDNTTGCAWTPINEGGRCFRGECVSGSGVCRSGYCIGGTNNDTLCEIFADTYISKNQTTDPLSLRCYNWTCNPESVLADFRGCVFNGNKTAGTTCVSTGSCATATCNSAGQCIATVLNNTLCNDGDGTTTDVCNIVASNLQSNCLNCVGGVSSGVACDPGGFNSFANGTSGFTYPVSYGLYARAPFFAGFSGVPLTPYYCNSDVCSTHPYGRCSISGICEVCASNYLSSCTTFRSCLKLIGIVIEVTDGKCKRDILHALNAQLEVFMKDTFVAVSVVNAYYPHCNYIDLSNSRNDDSMLKLQNCIFTIPYDELTPFNGPISIESGLTVYNNSVTAPDYIVVIADTATSSPTAANALSTSLQAKGTQLYGILMTCSYSATSSIVSQFNSVFGVQNVKWWVARCPLGSFLTSMYDTRGNVTVCLRNFFNATVPTSCASHSWPCTTASLNRTLCTCSVSTNTSANGQVCGPSIQNFPLCVQNATCNAGTCNPANGTAVTNYCSDNNACTTDSCNYTSSITDNEGCVIIHKDICDLCRPCSSSGGPYNETACNIRPEYTCGGRGHNLVNLPYQCSYASQTPSTSGIRVTFYDNNVFNSYRSNAPVYAIYWPFWQLFPWPANVYNTFNMRCLDSTGGDCYSQVCSANFTCGPEQTQPGLPCGTLSGLVATSTCNATGSCVAGTNTTITLTRTDSRCLGCYGSFQQEWLLTSDGAGCSPRNTTTEAAFTAACYAAFPDANTDCAEYVLCAIDGVYQDSTTPANTWTNVTALSYTSGNTTTTCYFVGGSGRSCCQSGSCVAGIFTADGGKGTCDSLLRCEVLGDSDIGCDDGLPCTFSRCCTDMCVSDNITDATISPYLAPVLGWTQTGITNPVLPFCAGIFEESATSSGSNSQGNFVMSPTGFYFRSTGSNTTLTRKALWQRLSLDTTRLSSVLVEWQFTFPNASVTPGLVIGYAWRIGKSGAFQIAACQEMGSNVVNSTCAAAGFNSDTTVIYKTTLNGTQFANSSTLSFPPVSYRIPGANLTLQSVYAGIIVYAYGSIQFYSTNRSPLVYLDFRAGCGASAQNCSLATGCNAGTCVTTVQPSCDDSNPCTVDSCDASTNACVHTQVATGTPCTTGDECITNQVCNSTGMCTTGNHVCSPTPYIQCGYYQCGMIGQSVTNASIALTDVWQYVGNGFGNATSYYVSPYSVNHNTLSLAGEGFPVILGRDIEAASNDSWTFMVLNSTFDETPSFSLDSSGSGHWFVQGNPYDRNTGADLAYKEPIGSSVTPWVIWPEATVLMLANRTTGDFFYDRTGAIEIVQAKNVTNNVLLDGYYHVYQKIVLPQAPAVTRALFGFSVAMSNDSTIVVASAPANNSNTGAAWVFFYNSTSTLWEISGGVALSVNDSATAGSAGLQFGISVHVSEDGQWAAVGAPGDNNNTGAVWIFTGSNTGAGWTQYGSKIVGTGSLASPTCIGRSVQLSQDGSVLVFSGACDTTIGSVVGGANIINYSGYVASNVTMRGTVWVYRRVGGVYTQQQVIQSPRTNSNFGKDLSLDASGKTLIVTDQYPYMVNITSGFDANYPPGIQGGAWMYFRDFTNTSFIAIDLTPLATALPFSATNKASFSWDYITDSDISSNGRVFALVTSLPRYIARGQQHPTFEFVFARNLSVVACNPIFQGGSCDYGANVTCATGNCTSFGTCSAVLNHTACFGSSCMECSNFMCDPFGVGTNTTTGCNGANYIVGSPCSTCFQDNITCTVQQCNGTLSCITTPINALCDDGDPCTTNTCNVTTGCVFTPLNGTGAICVTNASCNDNNSCTTDYCCGGRCLYVNNTGDYNGMCQVVGFNETNPSCPDCANCTINGICNWWENAATCPADCNHCNNNTICDVNEGEQCPDCRTTPCIPDGICEVNENQHNCKDDCRTCNNDTVCDVFENPSCPDCCTNCTAPNDGVCSACEGADTCTPGGSCDCDPAICNANGICDFYENDACPDCTPRCIPDTRCAINENAHVCPEDCTGCLDDGVCERGENASCRDCCV